MLIMLEEDVMQYAGLKGKHGTADRTGYRHGYEQTTVVMGGTKIRTKRPRVRSVSGDLELPLPTLAQFQREDPLNEAIMARLLAAVSTRKYYRTVEGQDTICTSKSEVSRRFIKEMDKLMEEFFTRPLSDDYPVIIIDGLEPGKMTILAAMGIARDGKKRMLGIIEGGSENSIIVMELLNDLLARGLDPLSPRLYVLDGSKALYKGVTDIFGKDSLIQRCQVHKKRRQHGLATCSSCFMGIEQGFRRIRGYKHMAVLISMLEGQANNQQIETNTA